MFAVVVAKKSHLKCLHLILSLCHVCNHSLLVFKHLCLLLFFVFNFSCFQSELLFTDLKLLFYFSRGNSVTSAPLLCCLFAFLSQSSLAFLLVSPSLSKAWERISSVFLRSVSTLLLLQDSLVDSASFSLSEISSNNTSSSVGSGDALLAFASSLLYCRHLPSSKSNLSLTTLWFNLNLIVVFLFHCFLSWTCKTLVPNFFAQQHVVRCCPLNWLVVKIKINGNKWTF